MSKAAKTLARKAKKKKKPVSAKAVVVSGQKILLLRQANGDWDLPGGKVDRKERVWDGLLREVWEETRIKVDPVELLTAGTRKRSSRNERLTISFLCAAKKPLRKKHIRLSTEHDGFALVDFREAKRLKLRKHHAAAIAAAERRLRKTGFGLE